MAIEHPNATQLSDSISDFLRRDILPVLEDPALQYQLRVAINGLAIIDRELASGAEQQASERALLAKFLRCDGEIDELRRQLCSWIQTSEAPYASAELLDTLQIISDAKLAIDNPRYRPVK